MVLHTYHHDDRETSNAVSFFIISMLLYYKIRLNI